MNKKVKIERLYDVDGEISGYKLGEWFLMKDYYYGNYYSWYIAKTDKGFSHYETYDAIKSGAMIIVSSYKAGIAKLKELNEQ